MTPTKPRACALAEARRRRDEAGHYLDLAELAMGDNMLKAAASNAVLAAIAAADAICGARLGSYNQSTSHADAVALLGTVRMPPGQPEAKTLASALARLLDAKSNVQYSPAVITESTTKDHVARARRLTDAARAVCI